MSNAGGIQKHSCYLVSTSSHLHTGAGAGPAGGSAPRAADNVARFDGSRGGVSENRPRVGVVAPRNMSWA